MSNRYAPLPNPLSDRTDLNTEMEAAFDYSDDEDDDNNSSESQPLNPTNTPVSTTRPQTVPQPPSPGTYDFENVDYDYPPPGSPPAPSAVALPNSHGNSNGLIPQFDTQRQPPRNRQWFRTAMRTVLPTQLAERLGFQQPTRSRVIGGGTNNDGVFANVTAKPSRNVVIQDGDDTLVVPETTRAEAPPSYASAQADAVPPYWETTIHAPFSPDSIGEMIIDSLPTGSTFSFLWNMLVSISFQFVGFLLTYLLHTTHAARLGSRAGLGITLIQYGFALRSRMDGMGGQGEADTWSGWQVGANHPTFGSAAEAEEYYRHMNATTYASGDTLTEDQANMMVADATTEWLSFFLMTVGWFILLTSVLGYWRVKRWERGIYASQQRDGSRPAVAEQSRGTSAFGRFENVFTLRGVSRVDLFRQGFGFGRSREQAPDRELSRAEEGDASHATETDFMIPVDPGNPAHSGRMAHALTNERRLQQDLRAAGLL